MHLLLVGLSHRTAPVEIREKLTFPAHRQAQSLDDLVRGDQVAEAVILCTCNRTEVYVVAASPEGGTGAVMEAFHDLSGLERDDLAGCVYAAEGEAVVRHLFRVVSSLDSMVVGEAQILGQCKEAYDAAFECGTAGRVLNKLFRQSFEVGKRVRTETSIGEAAVSISYAAVELAKKVFSTLEGRTILVVGAGKMSELTARHLVSQGVASVLVTNRTYERAVELAERVEGTAVPYENLRSHIAAADIVISSTGAEGFVIGSDEVSAAVRGRRSPLFLIDIAVPRDIDPRANELTNVFLYDIDDLSGVVESNMEERMREARRAEVIIADEVAAFGAWIESMEVVPTIAEMRSAAEAVRQEEYAKALKRLGGLSEKELATVEALTQSIVGKMLHTPTAALKRVATEKGGYVYVEAARRLYGLDAEEEKAQRMRGLRSLLGVAEKARKRDETGEQIG